MANIKDIQKIIPTIYQVGGSVRDEILGKAPKDFDYTTPYTPDEIEAMVKANGRRAYLTGKRFGTIGFKLDGDFIEVTSFRIEVYNNTRKPEVKFGISLEEDLSRRDFTINSLAKDIDGNIIDLFGGIDDINNKLIRCVGTPKQRFKEDPLRILRAIRFATQLGFRIDDKTKEYMFKMRMSLLRISKERWMQELDKILLSDNVRIGLDLLMELQIFNVILPELSIQYEYDQDSPYHDFDLWTHTKEVVIATPPELHLRWAALLHDIGKPFVRTKNKRGYSNYIEHEKISYQVVLKYSNYFKRSNDWTREVGDIVLNHMKEDCRLKQYDDMAKKNKREEEIL
jgi:tRNA nucleotidyltransferase (CCA-adding enzyme)